MRMGDVQVYLKFMKIGAFRMVHIVIRKGFTNNRPIHNEFFNNESTLKRIFGYSCNLITCINQLCIPIFQTTPFKLLLLK